MSLIGLWAFFFGDGNGVDGTGFGNTALFRNGAAQDDHGNVALDGVDDYVEIPHGTQYALTEGTINASFTVDAGSLDGSRSSSVTDSSMQTLVSRDSSGYDGGGHLTIFVDGDGSIVVRHQSDTQDYYIHTAPGVVTEGEEFTLTYSFSDTGGMTLYVDGVEVGSNTDNVTNGDSIALSGNSEPWTLGASQVHSGNGTANNLAQYLDGSIGHFEIYDAAMAPSELNTLHDLSDGVDDGRIAGTAGDDTIHGGNAVGEADGGHVTSDTIDAGAGDDVIYAGDGADNITAGTGNDQVSAGSGADIVRAGDGNDTVEGGAGNDTIEGGAGADALLGDDGNDSISGGSGNDGMYGGAGNDTMSGGDGNDTIYFGAGNDSASGGSGQDWLVAVDGFGQDTVVGGETGSDWDILDLRAVTSGVTVTFKASETGIATAGTDQVTFSEIELFGLTDQADSLDGTASSSAIGVDAGSGNDTVTTGSGSDTVLGNAGNDLIDGGAGNDSLDGGSGNDTLLGGAGADTITGGSGADSISAGAGDDVVYTGSGADTVDTGEGSDTIHLDDQDGSQSNVLTDSGVTGTDTIVLSTGAGTYRIQGEFSADQGFEVIDGSGATGELLGTYDAYANFDFTNITLIGVDQIAGTANADTITGSAGADSIDGGAGNDQLAGGAGDDTLVGGAGDDLITGGAGNDRFSVSDGHDTITDFNFGNTGALGDGDASNNDVLDLSGYYDSLSELRADQADDGVLNQSNTHDDKGNAVDYSDNTQFGTSSMTMQGATADSYTYDNTGIVCFTAGTRILTPRGEVAIESLRPGDLVTTLDHGPQPLLWIGTRHVTGAELEANETLRPVLIAKGAMGNRRDLLVSRQHGMLLGPDHLARAVHLARECRGIRIAHGKREVTYVHLLFATHQIVFAEGIPSESFYPGPNALRMMDPAARADLFRLLPGLDRPEAFVDRAVAEAAYGPTARPFAAPGDIAALHDSHQASCAA